MCFENIDIHWVNRVKIWRINVFGVTIGVMEYMSNELIATEKEKKIT